MQKRYVVSRLLGDGGFGIVWPEALLAEARKIREMLEEPLLRCREQCVN